MLLTAPPCRLGDIILNHFVSFQATDRPRWITLQHLENPPTRRKTAFGGVEGRSQPDSIFYLRLETDASCISLTSGARFLPATSRGGGKKNKQNELSFLTHHLLLKFHIQLFNHGTQIHMKQNIMCVCGDERHSHVYTNLLSPSARSMAELSLCHFGGRTKGRGFLYDYHCPRDDIQRVCSMCVAVRVAVNHGCRNKTSMNGNIMADHTAPRAARLKRSLLRPFEGVT